MQKEDKEKNTLTNLLPYTGSFIIFLGIVRLIVYYSAFNINIVQYLDFPEIITSFLDILPFVIIYSIINLVQNYLMNSKKDQEEKNELIEKILNEGSFIKRLKYYFAYYAWFLLTGFFMFLIYLIMSLLLSDPHPFYTVFILIAYLILFVCLVIAMEVNVKHTQLNASISYRQQINTVLLGLIFTILLIGMTLGEILNVADKKQFYGATFILDDNTKIVSDSTNYFIGKTKNYLFYHHEKGYTTDVYPMNRIKMLTFHHGNYR